MSTPRLLLTYFEPFGGQVINASQRTAQAIFEVGIAGVHLELLQLPVARFLADELILEQIKSIQPNLIIMLGEAGGRSYITPERIGINIDDYKIPDNTALQPQDEPIAPDGPAAYFSTLPIRAIVNALAAADIPAAISNSAGTYLCNRLFYSVLHFLEGQGSKTPAGFIHVPLLPEQNLLEAETFPSQPLETTVAAVRIAIQVSVQE